jgi:peptide/nickel transport system substrate-binding protein
MRSGWWRKNKNYWNTGLPYLDGIEFYNLVPFSPELGSGILSGRVDYGRVTDPVTFKKAQATKGMKVSSFNQSVIHATYTNTKRGPLADPRVRRAMHLALDRPTLIEAIKDVAPMQIGGFMYPFSDLATPKAELVKRLGYQDDPTAAEKEAKSLMAAAGHPNGIQGLDYLIRDLASYHVWSQAIQAMLQQTLNITCNLRYVVESVWFDDIANGHFDLAIGAVVSTLLDPSDYFNAWYHTDGPQNYSAYSNAKVDALIEQIDREVDPGKRQTLIREAEAIYEQDPPLLPVAWEKIDDIWYDYVKGLRPDDYFGAYDVCRQDTFWLQKT